MLQMLNVDVKKAGQTFNPEQGNTDFEGGAGSGDEEFRSSATNIGKKNLILPQLRSTNRNAFLNNSIDDNMKIDDENINHGIIEENKNDINRPKMYLINNILYILFYFI
jgi:hypothetical protein